MTFDYQYAKGLPFHTTKKAFKDMKNILEGLVVLISGQLVPKQLPFSF
jgi:hypothetical protein